MKRANMPFLLHRQDENWTCSNLKGCNPKSPRFEPTEPTVKLKWCYIDNIAMAKLYCGYIFSYSALILTKNTVVNKTLGAIITIVPVMLVMIPSLLRLDTCLYVNRWYDLKAHFYKSCMVHKLIRRQWCTDIMRRKCFWWPEFVQILTQCRILWPVQCY